MHKEVSIILSGVEAEYCILNTEFRLVWIFENLVWIWKKCTWIMNLYFSRKFTYSLCFIMFDWCFVGPVQPVSPCSLARVSQGMWAHTVSLVMWFISTVLLTDSCHDHAVIWDLSQYNPLVTLCLTLRDNTIRTQVSLNSCLCFWVNFGIPSWQDSREVAMGKSKSSETPRYRSSLKISWGLAPSDCTPGGGGGGSPGNSWWGCAARIS